MDAPSIVLVRDRIDPAQLRRLTQAFFVDMVKYVDDCIEYVSLINIRPAHGNRSMEVENPATRVRIRELTTALIGAGEALP